MSIFYQHVGKDNWRENARKTLGSPDFGLKHFKFSDIEKLLQLDVGSSEIMEINRKSKEFTPSGFQVWGIPEGASQVLNSRDNRMDSGDFLMLMESEHFRYAGQVIHYVSEPCENLSLHLWGDAGFPLIVILDGGFIEYSWNSFKEQFGFVSNYRMQGNTMRVRSDRVADSPSGTEESFIAKLLTEYVWPTKTQNQLDLLYDRIAIHLRWVAERLNQQRFRAGVLLKQGERCAVCGLTLLPALDAAHVQPKKFSGADDYRNGLTLCATHHRMFDAALFSIHPTTLKVVPLQDYSQVDLRITNATLKDLPNPPDHKYLKWRWDNIDKFITLGQDD